MLDKQNRFGNVGDLVKHLQTFDQIKPLILDRDGNTHGLHIDNVTLWNPSDNESPVAIYIQDYTCNI